MNRFIILTILLLLTDWIFSQDVRYSTLWFGPNASPIPEMGNAEIPKKSDFYFQLGQNFGDGDRTNDIKIKFEIPVLSERVSLKMWMTALEYYEVSDYTYSLRDMKSKNKGFALGDVYIQNRFRLINESKYLPNIVIQATLKSATGTGFKNRRYYDTPSYYFDLEFGKYLYNKDLFKFRLMAGIGFYSWQMYSSVQNDAPMYSLKSYVKYKNISLESDFSGYSGWKNKLIENYGDRPQILRNKLTYQLPENKLFISFEKGLRDFPYTTLNVGCSIPLKFVHPYSIKN